MSLALLESIPDPQNESYDSILQWVNSRIKILSDLKFSPDILHSFQFLELDTDFIHDCGPEASPLWRKFFMATLLADWSCYDKPIERADYPRLKFIMSTAYRGTRLWFCRLPDGTTQPVGYSMWYPISKFLYKGMLNNRLGVNDRGAFLPLRYVKQQDIHYIYAFNVSIIPPLRNTPCSLRVIRAYQRDAMKLGKVGIMAITVDEAGKKFSRIAKFTHLGDIKVQGELESLYVKKPT